MLLTPVPQDHRKEKIRKMKNTPSVQKQSTPNTKQSAKAFCRRAFSIVLACGVILLISVMVMGNSSLTLKSEIKEANVTLGVGNKDKNKIVIQITNTSDERISFSGFGSRGEISLTIFVGTQAEDLVYTESETITIDGPDDWERTKNRYEDNKKIIMGFELPEKVFEKNEEKIITLKNFKSNTNAGKAKIEVRAEIDGYEPYSCELEVMKKEPEFQIYNFEADPPYIITEEDKRNFKLKWTTVKADEVELYKNNIRHETLEEGVKGKKGEKHFKNDEEYEFDKDQPSFTTVYKLVATDEADRSKKIEKELTVQVFSPGWHKINFERYGYPISFCNMNDVMLYGIFIKEGKASLYSSKYPLSSWTLESADVPEGMETSPAVCYDNKLWLVGGGATDPDTCSRKVFYHIDGSWDKPWKEIKKVDFTARMGHTCVVFRDKIWILGGYDAGHNPLNEVWSLDANAICQKHSEDKDIKWSPRCMFAATAYKDEIWLYGGAKGPVNESLMDDMWTSSDGEQWESYKGILNEKGSMGNPLLPGAGEPIGCSLLVLKDRLHLLGAFWRDPTVEARKFVLEDSQERWHSSEIPEATWLDQADGAFKLLSVEYKGMIFLTWIDRDVIRNRTEPGDTDTSKRMSLNVYIP
jgi:hypothetical protein